LSCLGFWFGLCRYAELCSFFPFGMSLTFLFLFFSLGNASWTWILAWILNCKMKRRILFLFRNFCFFFKKWESLNYYLVFTLIFILLKSSEFILVFFAESKFPASENNLSDDIDVAGIAK